MSIFDKMRLKRLSEMRFPGRTYLWFGAPRQTDRQIRDDVGDGTSSNVVMSPIRWLQRSLVEAPLVVERDGEMDPDHDLAKLVRKPNQFYSGEHLLAATVLSLSTDGNAYWLVLRNASGTPVELWYAPHNTITPKYPDDGSAFLSHYEYKVAGRTIRLEIEDVVHFRDGIDPENVRKGLAPIKSLFREIWTDDEAANMVTALMKNGGVPGVVISPDTDEPIDSEDAEATKEYIGENFTRENRGKTLVMRGKTKVSTFGFTPKEMDLSSIRNISEERVCVALGVRPAVIGFGTGLQQTKVGATMKEERRLSWENGIIPLQRIIAGELTNKLLPSMGNQGQVAYDNSEIAALQEDETEKAKRTTEYYKAGIWTRAEAREATGRESSSADDVYLQEIRTVLIPQGSQRPEERGLDIAKMMGLKSEHTLTEQRLAENAPKATPPAYAIALVNELDSGRENLERAMEQDLEAFFVELGEAAYQSAVPVVKQQIEAAQIMEGLAMADRLPIFKQLFERHYLRVGDETDKAVSGALGVETGIPDPQARAIMAAGGTRAGLIDLDAQTRKAIHDALVRGRAEGLAGENLAKAIRSTVEAGPWSSAKVRARVIARTETRFAQSVSTIEKAKSIGISRAMVLDNRSGFGDEVCSAMNGIVVTLEEAQQLAADEHPNGTRNFSPLTDQLIEELGV